MGTGMRHKVEQHSEVSLLSNMGQQFLILEVVFQLIVRALVPRSLNCRAEEDLINQTFVIRASAGEVGG